MVKFLLSFFKSGEAKPVWQNLLLWTIWWISNYPHQSLKWRQANQDKDRRHRHECYWLPPTRGVSTKRWIHGKIFDCVSNSSQALTGRCIEESCFIERALSSSSVGLHCSLWNYLPFPLIWTKFWVSTITIQIEYSVSHYNLQCCRFISLLDNGKSLGDDGFVKT